MNRYVIYEQVPYESSMSWTVQADSLEEAKEYIKKDSNYLGESLQKHSERVIKGSTQKGIIKKAKRHYYE